MTELTENPEELVAASSVVILLFGEDACGPCHVIRFKLDKWLEGKEIAARYVDIKKNLELCA